ncbi:MAG TPA: sulfate/molybdate ABC transporter ATP-binding protein [Ensifer sp.]|nr:sulfate/molybdate ABC transporter ATP-binding protein [Ensifer sp.]
MDIRIDKIRKEFGDFPALHDVSLNIRSGELIALLGPSGSGKTTLLRLVAGLEYPTQGRILFGEEDASWKSVQERNVGFVFQHYALFKHMTVFDNVAFGLRVRGSETRPPKAEIRRRVEELIDMVQLTGMEGRYPGQLSGGQRQRVALARAMAIEPRVLLLDEPFGALDAKVRKDLRKWLREFHDRTGHTTLFVTHDQEEALELADRVVVMSQGKIEQVGSADDIYDRPQSAFVFSFVGDSAKLPVTVANGEVLFKGVRSGLRTTVGGGEKHIFFRPRDIVLQDDGPAFDGRILSMRRLAGARIAEIDAGLGEGAERVEIELPLGVPAEQGSVIRFLPHRFAIF